MSIERNTDYIDEEKFSVTQSQWNVIPAFQSLEALGEARSKFKEGVDVAPSKEKQRGFKIYVSSLEKLIPRFLEKIGKVPSLQIDTSKRFSERSIAEGNKLHEADLLFSLVIQGHTGVLCEQSLPTTKDDKLKVFQEATEGVNISHNPTRKEVFELLSKAWGRYFDLVQLDPETIPLPGFEAVDPRKSEEAYYSDELYRYGLSLAATWAEESTRPNQKLWEFDRTKFTQREVGMTIIPMEYPLSINTRLDFVSRPKPASGKVKAQIGDLKTGKPWKESDLLGEVMTRQAQLMLVIAERYTIDGLGDAYYPLSGEPRMRKEGKWFILSKAMFDGIVTTDRASVFYYKILDKQTGDITRINVEMDKRQRKEFVNWLSHLTEFMLEDPEETRKIIKGPNYVLRGVPVSMGGRDER